MATTTASSRHRDALAQTFADEEQRGLELGTRLRLAALCVVAVWITVENGFPDVFFFYPFLGAFFVLASAPSWLSRRGRYNRTHQYLIPMLEQTLVVLALMVSNPLDDLNLPLTLRLRFGNELYIFALLAASAFSYSPRVVLATGLSAACAWSLASAFAYLQPGAYAEVDLVAWATLTDIERATAIVDPNRLDLGHVIRVVVCIVIVTGALASAVQRSRRLVERQAEAERQRANLSRYFSANMVDELAGQADAVAATRELDAAVVFIDIVGFTSFAERSRPDEVIGLLREFHARVEAPVFEHGGTLDNFMGDGVLVVFGTPRPSDRDARNAVDFVRALLTIVADWNGERRAAGADGVHVVVGAHYGPVVAGDVGGAERLEFTVIGDTVNVASRLESLTRDLGVDALLSDDLLSAARREGAGDAETAGLEALQAVTLRGRERPLPVWGLRAPAEPVPTP